MSYKNDEYIEEDWWMKELEAELKWQFQEEIKHEPELLNRLQHKIMAEVRSSPMDTDDRWEPTWLSFVWNSHAVRRLRAAWP